MFFKKKLHSTAWFNRPKYWITQRVINEEGKVSKDTSP